jgi:hypothetical protein
MVNVVPTMIVVVVTPIMFSRKTVVINFAGRIPAKARAMMANERPAAPHAIIAAMSPAQRKMTW